MSDDLELFRRRLAREKSARKQAEKLIEQKSRDLYEANQELERFNTELERRVAEATAELRSNNELLSQRVRELSALNSVALALTSELRLGALLERIMEVSKEVMHSEAGSILLLDEETQKLRFYLVTGSESDSLKDQTVEPGQGIAGTVLQTGEPISVRDAHEDPRFDPSFDGVTGFRTRSLLAAPIRAKDRVIGVLEVMNRASQEEFDEHDVDLFQALASSVGVAIENARLFKKTVAMAEDLREALEKERRLAIEKEKMGAYVPKNVVDEISRNREAKLALGGKTVVATVLFADLKGFTKMSETMEAQRLVQLLNVHMTAMTGIIEAECGIVDKFIGDGIMAIFTDADDHEDSHALRGIRAGLGMQRTLEGLRREWTASHPEAVELQMRVGVNTGDMVAGNIGSETRMEYTVVGDNVNVGSRIESVCEPGAVWISESTYLEAKSFAPSLFEAAGDFEAVRLEPIQVKNRVQPVQTYAIRSTG